MEDVEAAGGSTALEARGDGIEVRYEHLTIQAKCYLGTNSLPSIPNWFANWFPFTRESAKLTILKDVSGVIKPGRMTLLLGPPSSGKTTMLLALAGKLNPSVKVSGRVTYNGVELKEFVPQKNSCYVGQQDLHAGEMTVQETLEFSARFQGAESARDTTDCVVKVLGLDICAQTMVGNDMLRGISGGQKKRVTTGEMIVGPNRLLLMDEISTGLDSSTTFRIMSSLKQLSRNGSAIFISLLQPAPETYDLFDDVLLLCEGTIVYQGPRDKVLDFFESSDFTCPQRKGVADFLQEVTSRKDQQQYWVGDSQLYRFVTVREFADKFKRWQVEYEQPLAPWTEAAAAALCKNSYSIGLWEEVKATFHREYLVMKRNRLVYIIKTLQIVLVGLMTMFVFRGVPRQTVDDGTLYLGSLFFGLITIMFNGLAELSMTIERLPVFFKHRDLKFYPGWGFSIPKLVLSIPLSLLESAVWTALTYYVIGYSSEASRFFRQFLLLFTVHQMSSALFRFIAALCRSKVVANTLGAFSLCIFFVLGGFIIPRTSVPKWWVWAYWISPLSFGENAISDNELLAPRWQIPFQNTTVGLETLKQRGIFATANWYWIGVAAEVGFAVLFNLGFTWALTYLNPLGRNQSFMTEETLAELEANQEGRVYQPVAAPENVPSTVSEVKAKGMTLPFEPLSITFENVNYYVAMPAEMKADRKESKLQLLKNVTGAFRPKVLTALMGVSGAGKTTLMDVLAGRKTGGDIEGDIRISGFSKKQETFARVSGYCEQNDIHSPQLTVHNSLVFSAWLRLPASVSAADKMSFVEDVIQLVELDNLRDALVGAPGVSGLSTEQRKRLTIAVELVANPSIIFMDEPTSGLDARAAAIVMRAVRNIVDTGRTIVCTIHQPSIDIFEAFDELVLMKTGGELIYAGPLGDNSRHLIDYFEAVSGVPKIKDGTNPAAWMLDVTSTVALDFADLYRKSLVSANNTALVKELSAPAPGSKALHFPTQYSVSMVGQLKACLWKQHLTYWRSPNYNCVRIIFTLVAGLMFGSIFWKRGEKKENQGDLFTVMGAIYGATIFLGIQNSATVQPVIEAERSVFYRERAAGMYSALPYAMSQLLIEIPYVVLQTLIYGPVTYATIGFQWTAVKFLWYLFMMFFTFLYFTYYGMMTVALTPNLPLATIFAAFFYSVFNLFSGFLIPRPNMGRWSGVYWICPVAWTVNGLITSQYGDLSTPLKLANGTIAPLEEFLKAFFGFHHDFLGVIGTVMVGFTLFFAFIFAVGIKYLNFQRR